MSNGIWKVGEWEKIRGLIRNLPRDLNEITGRALTKVGLKTEQIAVKHIKNQDIPGWVSGLKHTRYKMKNGYSEKVLVMTSTYMQSITSWKSGNDWGTSLKVYAGVKKEVKYPGGEAVANIAKVLEYGSVGRNIPARPLWRPTYAEVQKWIVDEQVFEKEAHKFFMSKYGAALK